MNDSMYRAGGNDHYNLPVKAAEYRNQMLSDMRAFDQKYKISRSQEAKHNIPTWILILACLPPKDSGDMITLEEIQSTIEDLEYPIRESTLSNAICPMISKNPKKIQEMSNIVRNTLALIGGIVVRKMTEGGTIKNAYMLNITLRKLQELVDSKQFTTYSFNLNDSNAVRLVGRI